MRLLIASRVAGIELHDIVAAIGLSRAVMKKRQATGRLTSQESDKVYRLVRLCEEATVVRGDADAASRWLLSPAKALGDEAPTRLIRTTAEFQMALDLIGQLQSGEII